MTESTLTGSRIFRFIPLLLGAGLWLSPHPAELTAQTWHLLAIFVAAIVAVMLDVVSILVASLLAAATAILTGTLTPQQTFAGFSEGFLLLIVVSFLVARGVVNSGLGRRIAYLIIARFGSSTLGLGYCVTATDCLIAPAFPSNTARAGVLFPIVQSLALDAGSHNNDQTRRRLGAFLMLNTMVSLAISSALWLTAMAANPTGVGLAEALGVNITFGGWFVGALAPSAVAFFALPYLLYRIFPPDLKQTPEAPRAARRALAEMGALTTQEWIMAFTFFGMVSGWALSGWLSLDKTAIAFLGLAVVFLGGVLTADDLKEQGDALGTYLWFALLFTLSSSLNELGFMTYAGQRLAGLLDGLSWPVVFAALVSVYVLIHYLFVSQSAQVLALFGVFLQVGLDAGVPGPMLALMLLYATNFSSCMTPQASSANALFVGNGYLTPAEVYRYGGVVTAAALLIYLGVGGPWLLLTGVGR